MVRNEKKFDFGNRKVLLFAVIFTSLVLIVSVGCASVTTPPGEEWNQTFGGADWDETWSVQQTANGGYILAGYTDLGIGILLDFWLVKTDSNGNEQWNKTFGGNARDVARSVQQTPDGGYVLAGHTCSYGAGYSDFWLVKAYSNGTDEWNKTFGGDAHDEARSVQQTPDGGYVLAGHTYSYGVGYSDFWLVKTYSDGTEEWNSTFGGLGFDEARSVNQTFDGGYVLVGFTKSYGAGYSDFWLVKTYSNGTEEWNSTFGGDAHDEARSVQQTSDGGYVLAGHTCSYGAGYSDFWLVKIYSNGTEEWNSTFGGPDVDEAYSAQQTSDGGFILAGSTESYGTSGSDFWLVKTDSNGNEQWNKTFGGTFGDVACSVLQTSEDGYILAGYSETSGRCSDSHLIKVKGESKEHPVHNLNTGEEFSKIQAAIDDPNTLDGHTLIVHSGTYYENVDMTKRINLTGIGHPVVDAGRSGNVVTVRADGCVVKGFVIRNSGPDAYNSGIYLDSSNNCTIANNIAFDNTWGISAFQSGENKIADNELSNNSYGIVIISSSSNNTIINNTISDSSKGIYLSGCDYNLITYNIAFGTGNGISLVSSSNNILENNTLLNNGNGIYLRTNSGNNNILNNTASNNTGHGIYLDSSNNNLIYNNYFNNTNNAHDGDNNIWNITKREGKNIVGGLYLGGNYWSDYAGEDTDGDGMGDTSLPYTSSGNIVSSGDYLPLLPIVLTIMEVSPPSPITLKVDETQMFTATAKTQNGVPVSGIVIAWSSSNTAVGTVSPAFATTDSDGKATTTFRASASGTTTVKAENGTINGTASATVREPLVLATIEISPPSQVTLNVGDTQQFTATANAQNGDPISGIVITWTSGNIAVGTVSPASATTDSDGKATTTFSASASETTTVKAVNGTVTGMASVTVKRHSVNINSGGGGGGGGGGHIDTDGDGHTNLQEKIEGTDPDDSCDPNPNCVACKPQEDIESSSEPTPVPTTPTPTPTPEPTPTDEPTTPPVSEDAKIELWILLLYAYAVSSENVMVRQFMQADNSRSNICGSQNLRLNL